MVQRRSHYFRRPSHGVSVRRKKRFWQKDTPYSMSLQMQFLWWDLPIIISETGSSFLDHPNIHLHSSFFFCSFTAFLSLVKISYYLFLYIYIYPCGFWGSIFLLYLQLVIMKYTIRSFFFQFIFLHSFIFHY